MGQRRSTRGERLLLRGEGSQRRLAGELEAYGVQEKEERGPELRFDAVYSRHRVAFHWIKGHAGHPENERCDALAVAAYHQTNLPEDTGYIAETQLL